MLFIRFTQKSEDDLARFKYFIHQYKVKFITCLETDANRPHTHTLLWTDLAIDKFRKQLVSKFPKYNGNEDWSLKTVVPTDEDVTKLERYVCKGDNCTYERFKNPTIVDYFEYTWELIEIRHKEYWERNKEIISENDIKKLKKSKSKLSWTNQLCKEFIEPLSQDEIREIKWDIPGKKKLFNFVLSKYGSMDKGFDAQILRRTCNALWNKLHKHEFVDSMFMQVYPEDAFAYNQYYT